MQKVIYVRRANHYDDMIKLKNLKRFSKTVYYIKKILHLITKKEVEGKETWILPLLKTETKYSFSKYMCFFLREQESKYVFSDDLITKENVKLWKKNGLSYCNGIRIKKFLVFKILEYIANLQEKQLEEMHVTVLVEKATEENLYIIQNLINTVKSVKIVSPNIYQFKKLEETLAKEGIALQLSNSYRKGIAKSKIIINLDRSVMDINEYQIFTKSIIIHCAEDVLLIKSKAFNGIVINSCNIEFDGKDEEYHNLIFYESLLEGTSYQFIFEKIEKDNVTISALIGNHGEINRKEFENLR